MGRSRWWQALLVLPFVGLMCGPLYARHSPELFGLAFFYTYEFACVLAAVALSWFVYRAPAEPLPAKREREEEPRFTRDSVPVRVRVRS